ncbi:MAG: asparagine synthase (glutamine-hydrolyzing) [Mariprofundaceae bacterium]
MCGFVGILGKSENIELVSMAKAVAQRGPDDQGHIRDGEFSAIHHRLAIIGPDERGRQPLVIDDLIVLFNGCIYNYKPLRRQLEQDGVTFQSDTDTEVLPHLYRRFGLGMFSLLNGMFAIAMWDRRDQQLIVARDPFGEKPLFICEQNSRIGIASSLTAFEKGNWSLTPNQSAVHDILCKMRIEAPKTIYQEVRQLPAGCYAVAGLGAPLSLRHYFFLPEPDTSENISGPELDQKVATQLDEVFLQRTIADKSVGIFLSGGIDSSLIAESLARQMPRAPCAFSVRFSDAPSDYDETRHASMVAKRIGCSHRVLEVDANIHETLDEIATSFDQPVANSTALPTYMICREAKQYVDVALSGVGGDEVFGGYPRYLGLAWHEQMRGTAGRGLMLGIARRLGEGKGHRNLRGRARRFLEGLDLQADQAYRAWTSSGKEAAKAMFRKPDFQQDDIWIGGADAAGGLSSLLDKHGVVNGAMAYDALTYLPDDLLAVGDRMSMANGIELRSPFLDVNLFADILVLDAKQKVDGPPWKEGLKLMLKRIAYKRLPESIVNRPKQGFMTPMKHWLRGPLAADVHALTQGSPLGGLVRPAFVQSVWHQHKHGEDRSDMLWALLLMDRWMQQRGWKF